MMLFSWHFLRNGRIKLCEVIVTATILKTIPGLDFVFRIP